MPVHIFGIRHHGPGSARSLKKALNELAPDCILIEGPPEGNAVLNLVADESLQPPVALLVYAPDVPGKAAYYPFAVFSPEWQAMQEGMRRGIPVRFIDLPQTHWLAMNGENSEGDDAAGRRGQDDGASADDCGALGSEADNLASGDETPGDDDPTRSVREDPLSWLAKAAGYSDGERWWEHMVEQRQDSTMLFAAILEAMSSLRQEAADSQDKMDLYREAHMRNMIRAAEKEGHKNIAVVCGAWHAPALSEMPSAKSDAALLKGLPKMKLESTWIPWTHSRLSYATGYGAGVASPGWYHHLWTCSKLIIERWMTLVARLLRDEDLDASSAHVIEAVRLAEALSALRDRPAPGLAEVMEAVEAVFCFGNDVPLRLIHERLIVGEVLGSVPEHTPSVPLQMDLKREQKRLRMPADAGEKIYNLDLRKENDLERSHLLHRLHLLNIPWGRHQKATGKSGTFHEIWQLRWLPDFSLQLIEAGRYGKTVLEAANARACEEASAAAELPQLTELLDRALLAESRQAVDFIMNRVQNVAAVAGDINHLMDAIPALVRVARYGNVRKTDVEAVEHVIDGILSRVCISLPGACASINDDAACPMYDRLSDIHSSVHLLQIDSHTDNWLDALNRTADGHATHKLLAGRATRLLLEQRMIDESEAARRFGFALSSTVEPREAANWAEGFLKGSGLLLIHDQSLWAVVDNWICSLDETQFKEILPLLRRIFSGFESAERRQIGEKVSGGARKRITAESASAVDSSRADEVLPVLAKILGLEEA